MRAKAEIGMSEHGGASDDGQMGGMGATTDPMGGMGASVFDQVGELRSRVAPTSHPGGRKSHLQVGGVPTRLTRGVPAT